MVITSHIGIVLAIVEVDIYAHTHQSSCILAAMHLVPTTARLHPTVSHKSGNTANLFRTHHNSPARTVRHDRRHRRSPKKELRDFAHQSAYHLSIHRHAFHSVAIDDMAGIVRVLAHAIGQAKKTDQAARRPCFTSHRSISDIAVGNVGQASATDQGSHVLRTCHPTPGNADIADFGPIGATEQTYNLIVASVFKIQTRNNLFVAIETACEEIRHRVNESTNGYPIVRVHVQVVVQANIIGQDIIGIASIVTLHLAVHTGIRLLVIPLHSIADAVNMIPVQQARLYVGISPVDTVQRQHHPGAALLCTLQETHKQALGRAFLGIGVRHKSVG